MATLHPLVEKIVERERAVLPDGFDSWGIKSVHPDLKTYCGYQWPLPGNTAVATRIIEGNTDARPAIEGDGLCVAHDWSGMASGGIPAITLLLVAYRESDVLGRAPEKLRAREVAIVAIVDGQRLLRECGAGANLGGANLRGADLRGADLREADLRGANLQYADLRGANLEDANLRGANLRGADLRGADLRGADLREAYLRGAYLQYADLRGANLEDANLEDANLRGADLRGANLLV